MTELYVFENLRPHKLRKTEQGEWSTIVTPVETLVMEAGRVESDKVTASIG